MATAKSHPILDHLDGAGRELWFRLEAMERKLALADATITEMSRAYTCEEVRKIAIKYREK
jgi:uncharacterized coiled-coil protein SlyX